MENSFPKQARLLSKTDFSHLRQNPVFASSGLFLFFHKPTLNQTKNTRIGISVSKKACPTSVGRNAIKRRVRETFRQSEYRHLGKDVLIVLNKKKVGHYKEAIGRVPKDLLNGLEKVANQ